mmetsp:Transcript_3195/g.9744  ORF Transcript_3195/g.9744 Transcript_3195/m.9744 type:complete len:228 (+) Transcript_3195:527-1210(+)
MGIALADCSSSQQKTGKCHLASGRPCSISCLARKESMLFTTARLPWSLSVALRPAGGSSPQPPHIPYAIPSGVTPRCSPLMLGLSRMAAVSTALASFGSTNHEHVGDPSSPRTVTAYPSPFNKQNVGIAFSFSMICSLASAAFTGSGRLMPMPATRRLCASMGGNNASLSSSIAIATVPFGFLRHCALRDCRRSNVFCGTPAVAILSSSSARRSAACRSSCIEEATN